MHMHARGTGACAQVNYQWDNWGILVYQPGNLNQVKSSRKRQLYSIVLWLLLGEISYRARGMTARCCRVSKFYFMIAISLRLYDCIH
jgi:hypothetical protein